MIPRRVSTRKKVTPESRVKADVRNTCQTLGILIYPIIGSPLQPPGLPDYWGCYKGLLLAIECKAGKNKLSPAQEDRKREIEAAGGCWVTAYSGLDVARAIGAPVLWDE